MRERSETTQDDPALAATQFSNAGMDERLHQINSLICEMLLLVDLLFANHDVAVLSPGA